MAASEPKGELCGRINEENKFFYTINLSLSFIKNQFKTQAAPPFCKLYSNVAGQLF
jgi:hypothetical protein